MKKLIYLFSMLVLLCACHHKQQPKNVEPIDKVVVVDECINADNADMSAKYEKYTWYETQVVLNNYLDSEYAGVETVTDVFQVLEEDGDPLVIHYIHDKVSTTINEVSGFWIEDFPLEVIDVTFEQSLAFINEVNLPKPHSKQVCLRKPIGPNDCNAQWVYGNIHSTLFVDAVTGKISETNPAFPQ